MAQWWFSVLKNTRIYQSKLKNSDTNSNVDYIEYSVVECKWYLPFLEAEMLTQILGLMLHCPPIFVYLSQNVLITFWFSFFTISSSMFSICLFSFFLRMCGVCQVAGRSVAWGWHHIRDLAIGFSSSLIIAEKRNICPWHLCLFWAQMRRVLHAMTPVKRSIVVLRLPEMLQSKARPELSSKLSRSPIQMDSCWGLEKSSKQTLCNGYKANEYCVHSWMKRGSWRVCSNRRLNGYLVHYEDQEYHCCMIRWTCLLHISPRSFCSFKTKHLHRALLPLRPPVFSTMSLHRIFQDRHFSVETEV